jgi:hypothetical protein
MELMELWVRRAAMTGLAMFGAGHFFLACGGPQEPAEAGETCYRDADCKAGLVCVGPANSPRKCSSDVSGLVDQVDAPPPPPPPPDAGMPMDDGAAPVDPADGG